MSGREEERVTLKQLEYFLALSKNCHFSNTASEIYVSQSTLSHSISELENELGVKLFERNGNNVSLTQYGKKYKEMIGPILTSLDRANVYLSEMSPERISNVHVGVFHSLYADFSRLIIKRFNEANPGNRINIIFYDRKRNHQLVSEVEAGVIEMTFSTIGSVIHDDLHSQLLFRQKYHLYVPENHPLAEREYVTFEDFRDEEFVVVAKHMSTRPYIDSIFESRGVQFRIASEQLMVQFVLNYVSNGYGVALLPYAKNHETVGVRSVPIRDEAFQRDIFLVWRNEEKLSEPAQRIKTFLIENCTRIYEESIGCFKE